VRRRGIRTGSLDPRQHRAAVANVECDAPDATNKKKKKQKTKNLIGQISNARRGRNNKTIAQPPLARAFPGRREADSSAQASTAFSKKKNAEQSWPTESAG